MPSQLINNEAVSFICARNFTYAGEEYELGSDFPQEKSKNIETLVRSRYLIPVVDSYDDKPRHWHREVQLRANVLKKLGVLKREKSTTVTGSSLLNKPSQGFITAHPVQDHEALTPWEETEDNAKALHEAAEQNFYTEKVLAEENSDEETSDEPEQTEPEVLAEPAEHETDDDDEQLFDDEDESDEVTEEDLYDPSQHTAPEVMEYLTSDISEDEYNRVLAAERAGKNRKGIVENA